jgi:predicted metal-dependent RNase
MSKRRGDPPPSFFADAKPAVLPLEVELEEEGQQEMGEVLITPLGAGQEVGRSCIIVEYA